MQRGIYYYVVFIIPFFQIILLKNYSTLEDFKTFVFVLKKIAATKNLTLGATAHFTIPSLNPALYLYIYIYIIFCLLVKLIDETTMVINKTL